MKEAHFRQAIAEYIRAQARPVDKFSHQPRVYGVARQLARTAAYDDDVLYASAWMHDLGVFIGHRPEEPAALAQWDHVAYALRMTPQILTGLGFPATKIYSVLQVIRSHLPSAKPVSYEGILLRDADILEQLGATGILRTVSKVGRDTRFTVFSDALRVLRKNLAELPQQLMLPSARLLAEPRVKTMAEFLAAADAEAQKIDW